MGYRTYIGSIPKREYNKIKSLTKQEMYNYYNLKSDFKDEEPYKGVYEFGEELYGFGKYTEFNPPKKSMKKFFKKKDLQERYSEYDFHVVTKEFLAYIIEHYTDKVKSSYKEMISPFFDGKNKASEFLNTVKTEYGSGNDKYTFDFTKITEDEQSSLFKIIDHIRSSAREWGINSFIKQLPYNLEKGNEVTTSCRFEYSIFELTRIYKSFDWKRNVMIYYGY